MLTLSSFTTFMDNCQSFSHSFYSRFIVLTNPYITGFYSFSFFFMRIVQNLMTLKAEKSIDSFVTLCNNKRTDQVQRALGVGVGLTKP